jgi:hypothetical protein
MPLVGDSLTGIITGPGTAPTIPSAVISGPYNFAHGINLDVELDGTPLSIALQPGSQAVATSDFGAWTDPPGISEVSISVNGGSIQTVTGAAWGSGSAAAIALNAGLSNVTVEWDGTNLIFRSDNTDDGVYMDFDVSDPDRQVFVDWLFQPGAPTRFYGAPVPTETVAALIRDAGPTCEVDRVGLGVFDGTRGGAGLENRILGTGFAGLPAGARLVVMVGVGNTGYYRITAATSSYVDVDRDLPVSGNVRFEAFIEGLIMGSAGVGDVVGITTSIGVLTASDGATALGFPVTADPTLAKLRGFELTGAGDFVARNVEVGDVLVVNELESDVLTVTQGALTASPGVPYQVSSNEYQVLNGPVRRYLAAQEDVVDQLEGGYTETEPLDTAVQRLIKGARYSSEISGILTGYAATLESILEIFTDYVVERESMLDQALRLMQENGFDRALDVFLSLELEDFFTLPADGVSYLSWVNRKAADVAREVVPVGKDTRDAVTNWRTLATQGSNYDAVNAFPKE